MLVVGQRFDRFVIEAELGRGGMGRVYRAHDTRLDRFVALKVLSLADDASATVACDARARLLREARAAAAFEHPNAVAIYDLGECEGVPFIAMELVHGRTLREVVGHLTIPWRARLSWLIDVARALGAAHSVGLVHRDVKPENVMLRNDGRIKVLDFGIARRATTDLLGDGPPSSRSVVTPFTSGPNACLPKRLTAKGELVGTPQYMAPEYIQGVSLDGRADQFAWAVMAYELFAGAAPWDIDDPMRLAMLLVAKAAPLETLAPELPEEVVAAITRALAKNPSERHASMEALVEVLAPHVVEAEEEPTSPLLDVEALDTVPVSLLSRSSLTEEPLSMQAIPLIRRREKPSRWRVVAGVLGAVAAVAVGGAVVQRAGGKDAMHLAPVVVPASAKKPAPASTEAKMAYAAAIQASRDASMEAAARRFEEATTLDPSFAAAHLRAAPVELRYEPTRARAHFQKAVQLRTLLDAKDQALLDGIEPIVRDPPDYAEADRRLHAGLERFPDDPELLYHTSWARFLDGRFAEAIDAIDRATRVAPDAASLSFMRANIELYGGTHDGALRALDRCLQQAPGATHCLQRRVLIKELDGQCAEAERDARRWLGADPESPVARRWLAQDLFALGKPRGAVDEMLRQAWAIAPAGDRVAMELEDRAVMDELSGNFAEGEQSLAKLDQLVSKSPELLAHVTSTWEQFQSYRETGDLTRAGTVAGEFLRRKDAWIPLAANDDFAVEIDLTPPLLAMQRRSGAVTGAEYDRQMTAWLDGWKRRLPRPYRGYLWIYGIAATVETREQARAALAALPEYEPLPWFRPGLLAGGVVGRVRLLAGDPKGALPDLALAAHSCRAFDDPVRWVQSSAWLGAARETTGDVAGACADHKRVTDRWGPASRSVTAREVRVRRAALRCR